MPDQIYKELVISHTGEINYENIGNLLTKLKHTMDSAGFKMGTYKKVLSVMVECLENIYKYMDTIGIDISLPTNHKPKFILEHNEKEFFLYAGNPVLQDHISGIKNKIDRVNNLEFDELKKLYKKIITNGKFTSKGGAGLGFIEMVKTTKNKIDYRFDPIDDEFSYFHFNIRIPVI